MRSKHRSRNEDEPRGCRWPIPSLTSHAESPIRSERSPRITDEQREAIAHFMQGAIYSWAKNRPNEPFAVRDLMGGENFFWDGTPLIVLYEKHIALGKSNDAAIEDAAKDLG